MTLRQCIQRTHSLLLISSFAAVPAHALGRAQVDDFSLNVKFAPISAGMGAGIRREFATDIRFHRVLIDADVVSPGSDNGHVGTGDGGHAAIGAAIKFEFKLVWECRPMKFVLIFISHLMAGFLGVIAGELAT